MSSWKRAQALNNTLGKKKSKTPAPSSDIFNGINEGDVVRIKFKPIHDITAQQKMAGTLMFLNNWEIGANINALLLGGDYVVVDIDNAKDPQHPHIEIDNHHDGGTFEVYPELIESIDVIEVANKFVSEEHGVIMIQVGDKIYINGNVLTDGDDETPDELKGMLTKFTSFMEKFVLAKAFENSLKEPTDKDTK